MEKEKKGGFSGQLGFVLAAAGSAVGVGNIWRFPYLAAKDGGGLFLIIYLILILTFGFTLLTSDIAIGRRTKRSSIGAYALMHPKWKFLGILTFIVPVLIMTYYAVIGGWITRYVVAYISGQGHVAASDTFFTDFIGSPISSSLYALFFMIITALIIYRGVQGGIEKCSRIVMPILLIMIIAIAIYSMTLSYSDGKITRTSLEGFLIYITPNFEGLTLSRFLQILLDAMSQLFFSLSVSMGIMITYGSYVKKEVNLNKSVAQIEIFDTLVAFLAGMMIIPAVYVFSGIDGMQSGPSLMFVSLPKVFNAMGKFGWLVGLAFFLMVAFAALTSCISVLEAIVSNCIDIFQKDRKTVTIGCGIVYCIASVIIALGYSVFFVEIPLPNGSVAQLLDLMDYISNSFMMPFISLLSTILIGWIVGPQWIVDEMEYGGFVFKRKKLYIVMIKYIVPLMMFVLFLQSTGILSYIL